MVSPKNDEKRAVPKKVRKKKRGARKRSKKDLTLEAESVKLKE